MSESKSARRRAEDKIAKAKRRVPDAMEYQRQKLEAETATFLHPYTTLIAPLAASNGCHAMRLADPAAAARQPRRAKRSAGQRAIESA